jgi:hypothetical protein
MQDRRSRRSRRARFAGCGGTARPHTGHQSAGNPGPFAWLRPAATSADWKIARLPSRKAQLAYPPRWRAIRTDPGTFPRCCWNRTTASAATSTQRPSPALRYSSTRPLSPCPQPRRGRPGRRSRRLGGQAAIPLGHRLVRDRPLRQHLRALQGDRLHRARDTGHHGRRRRGPASGLDTPGTPAPARGCELLELMQPGTSDTPAPGVTSGRLDWRGAHARSGRTASVSRRHRLAPASVAKRQRREADHSRLLPT